MASADVSSTTSAETPAPATAEENLEVVTLNVTDIDRAKGFYQSLGWRLDADFAIGDDFRIVQFTPPRSQCSIHFGKGLTAAGPGGPIRLILAATSGCSRRSPSGHGHPPRLVRGGRPAARLVGLVRRVHARAPGRERRGRGRRDGQPLHGRGQARRRVIRLTPGLRPAAIASSLSATFGDRPGSRD